MPQPWQPEGVLEDGEDDGKSMFFFREIMVYLREITVYLKEIIPFYGRTIQVSDCSEIV